MTLTVLAAYAAPFPSFVRTRGQPPETGTSTVDLQIKGVSCRGSAVRLAFFLMCGDVARIPGYLRLEAWPGPGFAKVRIMFDKQRTSPDAIKDALMEPYLDPSTGSFHRPAFLIKGYTPWGLPTKTP
jgi:hypothetical protein